MKYSYLKLPQLQVTENKNNQWIVPVKYKFGWYNYLFFTYKEAYDFYLQQLFSFMNDKER